jgi:hypothetical protein
MAGAAEAAGESARRTNTPVTTPLFGGPDLAALILFWRRGLSSFALRIRGRRWFRALRRAALWCWGVGDDVEIVGHGLHGGSSFC